jgi:hypothetical protein
MVGGRATIASAGRLLRAVILIALVVGAAFGTLVSRLHFADVRLPVLGIAVLASSPGWVLLALAARARGAPWAWLAFAVAWGAFPAVWIALVASGILEPVAVEISRAVAMMGPAVTEAAPSVVLPPLVEEPAKLAGVWIAFAAARRARAVPSVALGAAIGGLVGLGFGVAEAAHHLGLIVSELGFIDVDGAFVIDWGLIQRIAEQEFARRFFLAGLTNHAVFSALAGAGLALFALRRRRLALLCFVVALAAHGAGNAVGGPISTRLMELFLLGDGPIPSGVVPLLVAGWLSALGSFIVAEGWAALILVRILRREGHRPVVSRKALP